MKAMRRCVEWRQESCLATILGDGGEELEEGERKVAKVA